MTKRCSPALAALLLSVLGAVPWLSPSTHADPAPATSTDAALPARFVSHEVPKDLPGGAAKASLEQAAQFAWQEFIALNWPAKPGERDVADKARPLDAPNVEARVWETYRGRVEAYPGSGKPFERAGGDYEYSAPPRYIYDPEKVGRHEGLSAGEVRACAGAGSAKVPWNNLDEANHNNVRAGLAPAAPFPGQQILLESKVNKQEYVYVAARGWYGERSIRSARTRTGKYVRTQLSAPPPPKRIDDPEDVEYVSFPNRTIEVKAAWRRLGPLDDASRFYTNRVRYYRTEQGQPCYVDAGGPDDSQDRWGLVAFHVMHKTPSAPYFVWATFEQVDVLVSDELDSSGRPRQVETPEGTLIDSSKSVGAAFSPNLRVVPATAETPQTIAPEPSQAARSKHQLYFHQAAAFDIPELEHVAVNRRMFPIPDTIAKVNRAVQSRLRKSAPNAPFANYRLVSVQWVPLHKEPGVVYQGPEDPLIYYAANVIIEAPPVAQAFSGQFSHGTSKTSDYVHRELVFINPKPNPGDPVFLNTFFGGRGFLTGGCMGCHGTRQAYGTDWSFLLDRQRVLEPDVKPL